MGKPFAKWLTEKIKEFNLIWFRFYTIFNAIVFFYGSI